MQGYVCACFFIFVFNWGGLVAGVLQIGTAIPSLLHGLFGTHPARTPRAHAHTHALHFYKPMITLTRAS